MHKEAQIIARNRILHKRLIFGMADVCNFKKYEVNAQFIAIYQAF